MTAKSKLVLFTVLTALLILFAMMKQEKESVITHGNVDTLKPFQTLKKTTNLTAKRKELSP